MTIRHQVNRTGTPKSVWGDWGSLAAVSLVNKSLYINVVCGSCSVTTYRAAKEGLA